MDDLYKLIGLSITVTGFLCTGLGVYLRLLIKSESNSLVEKMRAELKSEYLTKEAARILEKDIARLER